MTSETRRILLDGSAAVVARDGDDLVAPDGRRVSIEYALIHPYAHPPSQASRNKPAK